MSRRSCLKLTLVTLLLGVAPPLFAMAAPPWQALQQQLMGLAEAASAPVMVLVILDEREPVLVTMRAVNGSRQVGAETPFRWGSISKTVTALTLLEAARRSDVDLTAPVAPLLSPLPYRNAWAPDQPLRLAHLLELTAGLADLSGEEFDDNQPLPLDRALARNAERRNMLWPPGLQHSYSNVPPGISAAVVESLTGESFEAAARRLIFAPLGMSSASFEPVAGLPGGFRADGRSPIPYWHVTFPAFGGLNASPGDMARLLQALLDGGRVAEQPALNADSVARAFRAETALGAQAGLDIGYGAGLYGWITNGHVFYGHGGDADGYLSRLGLLPEVGRGYLLGINSDDPALLARMRRQVEQALTADLTTPAPPASVISADLERFAGRYYAASTRFNVTGWQAGKAGRAEISASAGALIVKRGKRVTRLLPLGGGRFRREGDPATTSVFVEHDGHVYLQGVLGNYVRVKPGGCPGFVSRC